MSQLSAFIESTDELLQMNNSVFHELPMIQIMDEQQGYEGFVKSRCVCNAGNLIISMFSLLMLTCFMCVMCHTWKSVDKIIF